MKEVKIYEEDIQGAYKKGCEDVQKTLKHLYPGLKLGWSKEEEYHKSIDLTVCLCGPPDQLYFHINMPSGNDIVSSTACEDRDGYIWVPFPKREGIELGSQWNFKIKKRK